MWKGGETGRERKGRKVAHVSTRRWGEGTDTPFYLK